MLSVRTYTSIAALTVLALAVADPADGAPAPQPLPGQYEGPPPVDGGKPRAGTPGGRGQFLLVRPV